MSETIRGQGELDLYGSQEDRDVTTCDGCSAIINVTESSLFLVGMDRHGKGGRFLCAGCAGCAPPPGREVSE